MGDANKNVETTIELLGRIFNGTKRIRTVREQLFYDYGISKITSFQEMIIAWFENSDEETKNAIIEELDIKSEFLGFKYWIIESNGQLFASFGEYLEWYKK
ncbi:MAG: hypothetical protein NC206_05330 [Bacteroides sp.]|nr:hypothetical protein [Roseburia sp.]MCM1346487.1 hypothetical protein [Bacteroides sp.]MCM1422021.1 hypothetical protein [Bacteroides sp.]